MLKRTWPYGTRRKAVVNLRQPREGGVMLVCSDELGEGHILVTSAETAGSPGDSGELIFTEGGPTGGYWRFERSDG